MTRPKVVLHIGLHKTATRYLQRAVFRQLDGDAFLVNPEPLFHALHQAARHPGNEQWADAAAVAADEARRQAGERTLVLSDPWFSGDMYSTHADYRENLDLVNRLFPEARVIYCVRRQSDWLHSAYRQMLVQGRSAPIELFLNFRDGDFQPRVAPRVNGVRTVDARALKLLGIYRAWCDAYGAAQVYLFRQEDLRRSPDAVYERLAEALGIKRLPPIPGRVSGNRAFSALAIRLFFPGTARHPDLDRARLDATPPNSRFWHLTRPLRHLRTLVVRHGFDKVLYRDRDLLAAHGMREQLDAHYAEENRHLDRAAAEILGNGPGPRARAAAGSIDQDLAASHSASAGEPRRVSTASSLSGLGDRSEASEKSS